MREWYVSRELPVPALLSNQDDRMYNAVAYSLRMLPGLACPLAFAIALLVPIAIWNRYIFSESNLPFLLLLLVLTALILGPKRVPKDITFPGVTLCFFLLILYSFVRLDHGWDFELTAASPDSTRPGFLYVVDLGIFYFLFIAVAALSYKFARLSPFVWFLITGYIFAFIIRNSFDIRALQEGYNLSPGFVLVTLLPFLFVGLTNGRRMPFIPGIVLFVCILWLALIGARTAVVTLLIFYVVLKGWPLITRNRFRYFSVFWGSIIFITFLTAVYLLYAISDPGDVLLDESLVAETGVGFFQKRLGTRTEIWIHLLHLILERPVFGYGTGHPTFVLSPIPYLEFAPNLENLSAHSTYFELLYRLGAVGLLGFILIMFSIWKAFWAGREQWAVRVAGAFLLSILFFCSTGEYLVFNDMQLRSGFGWLILGMGAGACLRVRNEGQLTAAEDYRSGAG